MRARTYTVPSRMPYIPEAEVFSRTLTAIRTLKAMPDRERRFLASGSKAAWPATLVEWSDLVAQSDKDMEPLERVERRAKQVRVTVVQESPRDFSMPPMPEVAPDVVYDRLRKSKAGLAFHSTPLDNRPTLEVERDVVRSNRSAPKRDEANQVPREELKRSEISDALVAGEWFAKLALLPENIDEFEQCVEAYRTGIAKSPQVQDQKILTLYSQGWSLKLIGQRFAMNEQQLERRLNEISRNLFRVANRTARYADLHKIEKLSKERVPA